MERRETAKAAVVSSFVSVLAGLIVILHPAAVSGAAETVSWQKLNWKACDGTAGQKFEMTSKGLWKHTVCNGRGDQCGPSPPPPRAADRAAAVAAVRAAADRAAPAPLSGHRALHVDPEEGATVERPRQHGQGGAGHLRRFRLQRHAQRPEVDARPGQVC